MSRRAQAAPSSSKSSTIRINLAQNQSQKKPIAQPQVGVITPQIPPIYPPAPKPHPLHRDAMDRVPIYTRFALYVTSNYGSLGQRIFRKRSNNGAFNVERYIDRYASLLVINPDLVPRLGASRLPEELVAMPKQLKRTKKPKVPCFKKDIDDLHEEEEPTKEEDGSSPKKPKTEEATVDPMEEEEFEDGDEELDMGTDYAHNYFDNGEDFLDSDNDGDEDGPVY